MKGITFYKACGKLQNALEEQKISLSPARKTDAQNFLRFVKSGVYLTQKIQKFVAKCVGVSNEEIYQYWKLINGEGAINSINKAVYEVNCWLVKLFGNINPYRVILEGTDEEFKNLVDKTKYYCIRFSVQAFRFVKPLQEYLVCQPHNRYSIEECKEEIEVVSQLKEDYINSRLGKLNKDKLSYIGALLYADSPVTLEKIDLVSQIYRATPEKMAEEMKTEAESLGLNEVDEILKDIHWYADNYDKGGYMFEDWEESRMYLNNIMENFSRRHVAHALKKVSPKMVERYMKELKEKKLKKN